MPPADDMCPPKYIRLILTTCGLLAVETVDPEATDVPASQNRVEHLSPLVAAGGVEHDYIDVLGQSGPENCLGTSRRNVVIDQLEHRVAVDEVCRHRVVERPVRESKAEP